MKVLSLVLTVCLFALLGAGTEQAAAPAPGPDAALYTGMKACGLCHKKPESGNQLAAWQASAHAKAFETLGTPEARAAGARVGVDDPQTSGKCLQCHATAYNFTETAATDRITRQEGVTCESCHGPGKKYMAKAVMVDRAKSIEGGMIYPASQNCTKCHNENSPSWNPEKYTLKDGKKVGFDFEQAFEKIKHPDPLVKHAEPARAP